MEPEEMVSDERQFRDVARSVYARSRLYEEDARRLRAQRTVLTMLLRELGLEGEAADGPIVIVGNITLTAHKSPILGGDLSILRRVTPDEEEESERRRVHIQVHENCPVCGASLHSPLFGCFDLSHAVAEIGRWLGTQHNCEPTNDRTVGLRQQKN